MSARGLRRLLAALALLGSGQAVAQVRGTSEVEQLYLDAPGRGTLLVANGQTLRGGTFRVSAALQYSQSHVQTWTTSLLGDRFAVHVLGAAGLTHWLEVSGDLPIVVHQTSRSPAFAVSSAGLGTPFLHAKISILGDDAPFTLSTSAGLGIPVGSPGALGNSGLQFMPRVNLGRNFNHVQLAAEVGALVRGLGTFAQAAGVAPESLPRGDRTGSQLYLSLAASTMGEGLRAEATVRAFASLVGARPGVELMVGARRRVASFELFVLAGAGVAGTPTTPAFRLYGGASWGNGAPALPHCTESLNYPVADCPELDRDGDGVLNGVDAAPLQPEDKDGFQDADGAPDLDNDADGVLDGDDACRDVAGVPGNQGCPAGPGEGLKDLEEPTDPS